MTDITTAYAFAHEAANRVLEDLGSPSSRTLEIALLEVSSSLRAGEVDPHSAPINDLVEAVKVLFKLHHEDYQESMFSETPGAAQTRNVFFFAGKRFLERLEEARHRQETSADTAARLLAGSRELLQEVTQVSALAELSEDFRKSHWEAAYSPAARTIQAEAGLAPTKAEVVIPAVPVSAPSAPVQAPRWNRIKASALTLGFPLIMTSGVLATASTGVVPGAVSAVLAAAVLGWSRTWDRFPAKAGAAQALEGPAQPRAVEATKAPEGFDVTTGVYALKCLTGQVPTELRTELEGVIEAVVKITSHRGYPQAGAAFTHALETLVQGEVPAVLEHFTLESASTPDALTIAVDSMGSLELGARNLLDVLERSTPSHLTETSSVLAGKYGRKGVLTLT